jgi:hypothetical protein
VLLIGFVALAEQVGLETIPARSPQVRCSRSWIATGR